MTIPTDATNAPAAAHAPVIIVGAGAAGLALAYHLQRQGTPYLVLEQHRPGATWGAHYDSLHLHTLRDVSALPGLAMPAHYPRFPSAFQVQSYLAQYVRHFGLAVQCGVRVQQADATATGWELHTTHGSYTCTVLVAATGIWHNPYTAPLPGGASFTGSVQHARSYRSPTPFAGQRVLVVGVGNSGAELAVEVSTYAAHTGIVIRDGVELVDYPSSAVAMRGLAWLFRTLPASTGNWLLTHLRRDFTALGIPRHAAGALHAYPVVGYELPEAVAAGQITVYPAIQMIHNDCVQFADGREATFDVLLLATGYRPTLGFVQEHLDFDAAGYPQLAGTQSIQSTRNPRLFVVGMRYPTTAGWLQSIDRVTRQAAAQIAAVAAPATDAALPTRAAARQ